MSRRRRYAAKAAAAALAAATPAAAAPSPLNGPVAAAPGLYGGSGFDGANHSTRRGYIYFPTLETRREVDTYSRLELIRRSRWLRRNTGYAKRCVNGLANMVGFLMPRALTADREWNRLAEQAWKDRACNAETFDLSGRFNVNEYQRLITRSRLGDGDILSVLTQKHGGAAVMTYEAHQVAPGKRAQGVQGWRDGVCTDTHGSRLGFSVVADWSTGETVDIPAAACILNADLDAYGWQRGVTALHHAVNNLLDVTEISSDLKLGIKTANRIGYYEYSQAAAAPVVAGAGDIVRTGLRKDTSEKGSNFLLEDAFRGGRVPRLPAGTEIKQLLDERPHPNSMQFLEYLNRDIAAGLEMSSDVLWNIAKLGGASVRYVLADAQSTVTRHQQLLVDQFLTKFWLYFVSYEMATGRLRPCTDPRFWAVGWIPPQQLTVDIARDGKLSIDLHRAGMLTARRWYGMQGLDDEEEDRQRVEEYARRIALCREIEERYKGQGLDILIDPERVFPTSVPGAAPAPPTPRSNAPEEDAPTGRFSDPEAFQYFESRLDEIEARFGRAA